MKITKIDSWQTGEDGKLTPASRVSTEDFSIYLQSVIEEEKGVGNAEMKSFHEVTEIALKEEAICNRLPVDATNDDITINRINSILEDLETFSELLSSSEFDPRKADNTMSSVLRASMGDDRKFMMDNPLGNIEEEVRVFSLIESIKWKRGDYL